MAKQLLEALLDFCVQSGWNRTYWVAFSGGLDSTVLLSLCAKLASNHPIRLSVIHVNHGLSLNAKTWAKACANIAKSYSLPFFEHTAQLQLLSGKSLEEAAREMRYEVFSQLMAPNDILLTAHQQDDQAETLLLQLLRGSGLKGLSAMPAMKPLGHGFHGRPLLPFSRAELTAYAIENQLSWVEDESNLDSKYSRNFLRNHVMPLIKERWPAAGALLSRTALHCADADYLLGQFGKSALVEMAGSKPNTLSVKKLLTQDAIQQRWLLRTWLINQGYLVPDTAKLRTIQTTVLNAKPDRFPRAVWQKAEIRRYRDDLYVMACLPELHVQSTYEWDLSKPLALPGIGTLIASKFQSQFASLRFRQGGEMLSFPNRRSHTLKNLFQEWGVPPWERNRIPLIFVDGVMVGVVGYFMGEGYEISLLPK